LDTRDNCIALLSINQAAAEMKIGKKRIDEMIHNGEIGIIEFENNTIKIPKSELIRWVQERIKHNEIKKSPDNGEKNRKVPAFDAQSVMNKIMKRKGTNEQR